MATDKPTSTDTTGPAGGVPPIPESTDGFVWTDVTQLVPDFDAYELGVRRHTQAVAGDLLQALNTGDPFADVEDAYQDWCRSTDLLLRIGPAWCAATRKFDTPPAIDAASGVAELLSRVEFSQRVNQPRPLGHHWMDLRDRLHGLYVRMTTKVGPLPTSPPWEPQAADIVSTLQPQQSEILLALLRGGHVGSTRRTTRQKLIGNINRKHNHQNYGRAFSGLNRLKLVESATGPGGGVWLTAHGTRVATRLPAA